MYGVFLLNISICEIHQLVHITKDYSFLLLHNNPLNYHSSFICYNSDEYLKCFQFEVVMKILP